MEKIKAPVYLKSDKNDSSFHKFLEHWILWKREKYKNKPRGNCLIIRSLFVVFTIFSIMGPLIILLNYLISFLPDKIFCINLFLDNSMSSIVPKEITTTNVIVSFFGAVSILYWNIMSLFNKKWAYCCELYNKIISKNRGKSKQKLLENALAVDLLTLDLWAHRSFSKFFSKELTKSIKKKYCKDEIMRNIIISKANEQRLTENEAWDLLNYRHEELQN